MHHLNVPNIEISLVKVILLIYINKSYILMNK